MSGVKLNCLVLIGASMAIRADEVDRVDIGFQRTRITMVNGTQYSTTMSVAEAVAAINTALNFARAALSPNPTGGDDR